MTITPTDMPPLDKASLEGAVALPGSAYPIDRIVLTASGVYARSAHNVWIMLAPIVSSNRRG